MSEKKAEASRIRWAKIPPEERSRMMREAALKMHSLRTPEQKHALAMKMVKGRNKQRRAKKHALREQNKKHAFSNAENQI
jgi:hypothetical protein